MLFQLLLVAKLLGDTFFSSRYYNTNKSR